LKLCNRGNLIHLYILGGETRVDVSAQ